MAGKVVSKLFHDVSALIQNSVTRTIKGFKGELIDLRLEKMIYDFKDDKANENWLTISDADFGGKSEIFFLKSKHGQCVFKGNISTILPGDESEAKYSGFCAAKSKPLMV